MASTTVKSLLEAVGNYSLLPHLFAPIGEARVTSDLPLEVELTLAVPTEVNGTGLDMDVHQVVNDPALDVILNPIDQEPPANIDDFDERKLPRKSTARIKWGKKQKKTPSMKKQPCEVSQST